MFALYFINLLLCCFFFQDQCNQPDCDMHLQAAGLSTLGFLDILWCSNYCTVILQFYLMYLSAGAKDFAGIKIINEPYFTHWTFKSNQCPIRHEKYCLNLQEALELLSAFYSFYYLYLFLLQKNNKKIY